MRYTVVVRHPETDTATAVLAGKPVPAWAKGLVHDDDLVDATSEVEADVEESDTDTLVASEPETPAEPDAQPQTEDETPGYDVLTIPALKAEIDKRNEGREADAEIEVEGAGNKPDLIAALVADDAAQSDTDN